MPRTQYLVLRTQYLLLSAFLLAVGAGCGHDNSEQAAAEPSFAEQLEAVRSGKSEAIAVTESPVTDQELAGIASAIKLRVLQLDDSGNKITASGIRELVGLPDLQQLRIRGSGFDDAALAEAAKIKSLEILNIPQADLTDAGLAELKDLPDLIQLRFGSPQVTDAGMKTLAELPALLRLHLIDVPITDAGLAELTKIERLESLYIDGATISDAAWDELFRQRPKLHVHINQQHHDRDPHKHPH